MNRLLRASSLLFCIAGTCTAGCSSTKTPTAVANSATGGQRPTAGSGGDTAATGGSDAGGSDSGTQVDSGPQDTAIRTITPDDTDHLLYSGRIDFSDPTRPTYLAPGVVISARFIGVSVTVKVQDSFQGINFYEVVIDHDPNLTFVVQPTTKTNSYTAFTALPYGEHLVEFVKRTETSQGAGIFLGFDLGGVPLPAPTRPTRRLEIIGDSISAGSGDEPGVNQVNCNTSGGNPAQNAYLSYGAELARNLNAEYYITAAGGRGVFENYECGSLDTLPAGYDHMNQRDLSSPLWDHTKYVPEAIIIDLGTNDFSPDNCNKPPISPQCDPVKYQMFITTFEDFVSKLRGYYPNAEIFLTSSPMLSDGWPDPVAVGDSGTTCPYTSRTSQIAAITSVVQYFNADAGDSKVHLVATIPKGRGFGCGSHPNVTEQMEIGGTPDSYNPNAADMLLNPVKTVMGW
jgi:hypothetical protein